ncbi:unnamed protein product [marine sediment metagenome]|uniref:Uncharacterized protein n=1 Tax=marine sediment metagenome TaxID=412755 RepID=X1NHG4_9ZZZZ
MKRFLSQSLTILGWLLVGFGVGVLITEATKLSEAQYALMMIGTLVLGGFLIGIGILRISAKKKEKKEEKELSV